MMPANDEIRDIHETTCCVVGAGPAGAVLALLLARRGVDVVLLEAHQDFDREFRGDTLHPAILVIMSLKTSFSLSDDNKPGERPLLIASGESDPVSYGLYQLVSRPEKAVTSDCDLLFILRNTGAKYIDLAEVTTSDFKLKDSEGKDVKFVLRVPPSDMAFGAVTVAHLHIPKTQSKTPWVLQFESKPNAFVPFQVSICSVKPVSLIREDN